MAHDRRSITNMERVEHCLIQLVGTRYPSMLPLMLDPAFDDKAFYDPPGFRDILPHPTVSRRHAALRSGTPRRASTNSAWRSGSTRYSISTRTGPRSSDGWTKTTVPPNGSRAPDRWPNPRQALAEGDEQACPTAATNSAVATLVLVATEPHRTLPLVIAP